MYIWKEIGSCHCHVFECYSAICKRKGHDPQLCNRLLDIPKPQGVYSGYCSFQPPGCSNQLTAGYCQSSRLTFRCPPCGWICHDSGWFWSGRQGKKSHVHPNSVAWPWNHKVLSVACDNASPNNIMIDELADLLIHFSGTGNCVHCFYIINLIAWKILKEFDLLKNSQDVELGKLAEELETRREIAGSKDDDDNGVLFNICDNEPASEDMAIVHKMLVEVSPLPCWVRDAYGPIIQLCWVAYTIKNSLTLILPQWWEILKDFDLKMKMMPQEVTTRWNSSFDMLDFALEYRCAIDAIIDEKEMKLRWYDLSEEDWRIVWQLWNVLKVHFPSFFKNSHANFMTVY